uniref:CCHC-type domain-containing protein n=1 Tax=Rhipicephalus pulchellus TaxID=72859 RepID=L7LXM5_RHIPC
MAAHDDASDVSATTTASPGSPSLRRKPVCPRKLMAPFDEQRDDLDAYLHRFERIAIGQGWEKSEWANALSLCLVGEALSVFGRMPAQESLDYDLVKKTLLERFRLNAEGLREKFRTCRPENSETGKQFVCRLTNYFDRWIELSDTEKTYEGVRDKIVGEQFLNRCSSKLAVFLKERKVGTVEEMARQADQFLEAQGLRNLEKGGSDNMEEEEASSEAPTSRQRAQKRCFLCNRVGHVAMNCRKSSSRQEAPVVC